MPALELTFESGESSLDVRHFDVREAVSALFTTSIHARSPSPDLETIVGRKASAVDAASPNSSVAQWILGGVGAAGLIVGAALGGLTVHDYSVATDQCSSTQKKCTTEGANAEAEGSTLGPATTVALIVGGAGVAAAGIWLGVRGSGQKPAAAMGLAVTVGSTAGGAGIRHRGKW